MSNISLPKGFLLSTTEAAVKRPGRKDMALVYSSVDATAAGVFTKNKIKGAPVKLSIRNIKKGKGRAIILNSGNANVSTGKRGDSDAEEMASSAAGQLGIDEKLVLVCSTGVIGTPLPMERIRPAIGRLTETLGSSSVEDAAAAIMTTDTFPKFVTKTLKVGGKTGRITAFAKGSGMIAPNMATMLAFILTDLSVEHGALKSAVKDSSEGSFNRVTVDGDMSTSDTVIALANGLAGNPRIKMGSADYKSFSKAFKDVSYTLARMIAKDGEGATKLIELVVEGAKTEAQARKGAFAVANSLLFKTACFGNDANWGRIAAAVGSAGIDVKEEKINISFGKVPVAKKGVATGKDAEAKKELMKKEVRIVVDLGIGPGSFTVLTCDLSTDYVRINAEYRT